MPEKLQKRKRKNKKGMCLADRPMVEAKAAGIDIGAREIYVAVPPDLDPEPVRVFASFTEDLNRLADWLVSNRDPNGGDGVHRSVLDSVIRDPGSPWTEAVSGECAAHEKCSGAPHRLA